jgi:hypothetical protein
MQKLIRIFDQDSGEFNSLNDFLQQGWTLEKSFLGSGFIDYLICKK